MFLPGSDPSKAGPADMTHGPSNRKSNEGVNHCVGFHVSSGSVRQMFLSSPVARRQRFWSTLISHLFFARGPREASSSGLVCLPRNYRSLLPSEIPPPKRPLAISLRESGQSRLTDRSANHRPRASGPRWRRLLCASAPGRKAARSGRHKRGAARVSPGRGADANPQIVYCALDGPGRRLGLVGAAGHEARIGKSPEPTNHGSPSPARSQPPRPGRRELRPSSPIGERPQGRQRRQ